MSFSGGEFANAENNKQHLNLSPKAYEVIQSDMFTFHEIKLSGFINRVFENYAPVADASVSRRLNHRKGELTRLLSEAAGDEKTKERIINILLKEEKERLVEKALSYEKGKPFKVWLNKKNLDYLTKTESECCEEQYYGDHRGKYIKSVLEEYARLPYVQRERIYFTAFIEEIERAIQGKYQLRVMTGKENVYSVYSHGILVDPLSTANYLVGFSRQYSHPEDNMRPCSFRISGLKSIHAEKSKSAFLKEEKRKELAQIIASRGVQFTGSEKIEDVSVRLTKEGKAKFQRQLHLRPMLVGREEDIFKFVCTEAQADFYFFKFGADAEIIEPKSLREKFKAMYECALLKYGSD